MPPRTRTRGTKVLKENIDVVKKNRVKSDGKVSKPRKALADKTNSLSDDNASIDVPVKSSKKSLCTKSNRDNKARPKRDRRLPPRYIDNGTLINLSNNKGSSVRQSSVISKAKSQTTKTPVKELATKPSQDDKCQSILDKLPAEITNNIPPLKRQSKPKEVISKSNKPIKTTEKQAPITKYLSSNENGQLTTRPKRNCHKQPIVEKSQDSLNISSPFKTPSKELENSLVANRPKRVHRLPSRFEDHSISPNKFIPVQPCHASTPLLKKNIKIVSSNTQKNNLTDKRIAKSIKTKEKPIQKVIAVVPANKANSSNNSTGNSSPDKNNNGKNNLRPKRATVKAKLQINQVNSNGNKIKPFAKRLLDKSLSFRVLEDKHSDDKGDVYEFTFDPNEEPTPQKKKRKRPARKRPPKPKTVVVKSNYDDNVSKAIESLKNRVKPSQTESVQSQTESVQSSFKPQNHAMPVENQARPVENLVNPAKNQVNLAESCVNPVENRAIITENQAKLTKNHVIPLGNIQSTEILMNPVSSDPPQSNLSTNTTPAIPINDSATSIHASNYASICVEDIAADFELSQNDINYSPVNSPHQQPYEAADSHEVIKPALDKDPLNLQEGVSFFEEPPVASSSMNLSVRHPLASPWRVEFGSLPMKWHNNTYVKPNMTPAVQCSFINSEQDSKKKHVYTNMLTEEPLPEIFDNPAPALKQTSIISFIKEVIEKKASKKKRRRSPSPVKTNTIFEDVKTSESSHKTPKKAKTAKELSHNISDNSSASIDKENSSNLGRKSLSPQKGQKIDKDCTYFGFDESENIDQENVSPLEQNKKTKTPHTRCLRSQNVLRELNSQPLPSRAVLPVNPKAKLPSSEMAEQMYDQLKSTEDAQFPSTENPKEPNLVATNLDAPSWCENDSQSIHLFEDLEVVHHLKPHRKSYGKAKKVTFTQTADSDSDSQPPVTVAPDQSSDEDDLADLTFQEPNMKQKKPVKKKKKPKKLLTKKEEKEVEEWAAGFNSMCEDIDEFPLLVE